MVAVEVEKMLRLAEQCLERAKSFIGRREEPPDLSSSSCPSSSSLHGQSGALNHQTTYLLTTTTKNTGEYISSNHLLPRGVGLI